MTSSMPQLARDFRVICPDLRGVGWSDAPSEGYERDQLVADVLALLDSLAAERVHVVAHDWSALVGFILSLDHPERVRSYLCLAIPHPFIRLDPRALTVMWRLWFQVVIATPVLGPVALRAGTGRLGALPALHPARARAHRDRSISPSASDDTHRRAVRSRRSGRPRRSPRRIRGPHRRPDASRRGWRGSLPRRRAAGHCCGAGPRGVRASVT